MTTYDTIRLEIANGVSRLTLHRPDKLNSLNAPMHEELRTALAELSRSDTRVLILAGAGRAFCAGQDLAERKPILQGERIDLGANLEKNFNPLVLALQEAPYPVIAQVQGVAAGAGASLALACDLVVAGQSATFTQSFVRIGLLPDAGATWWLPRRLGMSRAVGLALLGDPVTAVQAENWGMIWRCVEDAQLEACVQALAARLAAAPAQALTHIKRTLRASLHNDLAVQLGMERDAQRVLGYSPDYREGLAAFFEKRTPQFGARSKSSD